MRRGDRTRYFGLRSYSRMVGKPEVNHGTLGFRGWLAGLEEVLLHALSHISTFTYFQLWGFLMSENYWSKNANRT